MNEKLIQNILYEMEPFLNQKQNIILNKILVKHIKNVEFKEDVNSSFELDDNLNLLNLFISSKRVEGCSEKTLNYYHNTITQMFNEIDKRLDYVSTDDLRAYLGKYRSERNVSKTTIDNVRRILSSFFSWLEDEDYILKNPVRRIHKIKKGRVIKDVLSDEHLEILRDNCEDIRDLAMLELLISTGIRVGELVNLNINDVNFNERECVVFGKGESEREVYFDAKTKIHLLNYLETRVDNNPALFVSLRKPYVRLGISGVERRLRELGQKSNINKVHPHKFRRTLATNAIDKGMPIEQVQRLLGHVQIDTTMQYAMVNQNNVKLSHKKFIS